MNVSAIIVTRGNVDLDPILASLPDEWEQVIWNNGETGQQPYVSRRHRVGHAESFQVDEASNLGVYGRYAAIEHARFDLIYVQDDDCIVSDPQAIADAWDRAALVKEQDPAGPDPAALDHVVCNMPEPWRSNPFYARHALVGFGAAFHRDAPERAFMRYTRLPDPWFRRTCDVVFTALTPRVLVDIPHESMDYASADDRMWRQPTHQEERQRMLDLALAVADGT